MMRLLLVEDEPDLVSGLVRALRKEGYSVDVANDGEEGLRKALSGNYNAIILDIMLPKMDGWDLLRCLREKSHTPVLILTARDATVDRVRGLDGGADDYLVKPFDVDELLSRLRALIRRSNGQSSSVVKIGGAEVNFKNHTVTLDGEPVILTGREFALLEYLLMNRGETVTRTALHEHLFDESADPLSNLIEVHIFNLRKKLGRDFIQTRRGLGYSIA